MWSYFTQFETGDSEEMLYKNIKISNIRIKFDTYGSK